MHINEITLKHDLKSIHMDYGGPAKHLEVILRKNGWHTLGTGAEAAVAENPQKAYVLKIFPSGSPYEKFVKFVKAHADNPHVPKFSRYVRPVPGTNFSYVRMEKLVPINHNELMSEYFNYLLIMMTHYVLTGQHLLHYLLFYPVQDKINQMGYQTLDLKSPNLREQIYQKIGGYPPDIWKSLIDQLASMSKHEDLHWDMHAGNFMRRGKTLIIADPFY